CTAATLRGSKRTASSSWAWRRPLTPDYSQHRYVPGEHRSPKNVAQIARSVLNHAHDRNLPGEIFVLEHEALLEREIDRAGCLAILVEVGLSHNQRFGLPPGSQVNHEEEFRPARQVAVGIPNVELTGVGYVRAEVTTT